MSSMSRTVVVACSVTAVAAFVVGAPASPAWAGTEECTGGGSFTITSNVVSDGGTCVGTAAIPSTVTSIGIRAFQDATGLTSVTFEADSSLQTIGQEAFRRASGVTAVVIPKSVTSIGTRAFQDATGLTSVAFEADSSLHTIGQEAFRSVSGVTAVVIPKLVTSIGARAFQDATRLTSVTFEADSSLLTIGFDAFRSVSGVTTIVIPKSVTSIGARAFQDATALTSVTFEGNAPTVADTSVFANVAGGATANIGFTATGFEPVVSGLWQGLVLVRAADPSAPAAAPSSPVGPQLGCIPDGALTVGAPVTCTVTGGDARIDILWRAAYNPLIAEQGVTLDANGSGAFSFLVPATAVGAVITVELVEWLAPVSLGVVNGPVPASVPTGEGPVPLPMWPLVVVVVAIAGGWTLQRVSRPGWPALRVS